jgi:toxin ParE1/3/4
LKLRWLPRARYDLDRQLDYLAERNPAAAIETTETIDAAVRRLRKFPGSGRAGRLPGTRELVVTAYRRGTRSGAPRGEQMALGQSSL